MHKVKLLFFLSLLFVTGTGFGMKKAESEKGFKLSFVNRCPCCRSMFVHVSDLFKHLQENKDCYDYDQSILESDLKGVTEEAFLFPSGKENFKKPCQIGVKRKSEQVFSNKEMPLQKRQRLDSSGLCSIGQFEKRELAFETKVSDESIKNHLLEFTFMYYLLEEAEWICRHSSCRARFWDRDLLLKHLCENKDHFPF